MRKILVFVTLLECMTWVAMGQMQLVAPEGALAFPKDAAGISAWVKLERTVKIDENLSNVFYRIVNVSASHILGTVEVSDYVKKSYPHVYVDVQGWIIAFFLASEPTASIIKWSGDGDNPRPVISTTLEAALEKVISVLQSPLPKPTFYDFRYPDANAMLILMRVLPAADTKVMYVKFPSTYKIYQSSFYHYGCNLDCSRIMSDEHYSTQFEIDGSPIANLNGREDLKYVTKDLSFDTLRPGYLHEFKITFAQPHRECGSAGIAIVIIYKSS